MDLAMMSLYQEADRQSPVSIVCKKGVRLWGGRQSSEERHQQSHPLSISGRK